MNIKDILGIFIKTNENRHTNPVQLNQQHAVTTVLRTLPIKIPFIYSSTSLKSFTILVDGIEVFHRDFPTPGALEGFDVPIRIEDKYFRVEVRYVGAGDLRATWMARVTNPRKLGYDYMVINVNETIITHINDAQTFESVSFNEFRGPSLQSFLDERVKEGWEIESDEPLDAGVIWKREIVLRRPFKPKA